MRSPLTVLGAFGLFAISLGACAGPDLLVGANAGAGRSGAGDTGGSGVGGGSAAAGGSGGNGSGGVGGTGEPSTGSNGNAGASGSSSSAASVNYYLTLIRPGGPDICMPRPLPVDDTGVASCRIYAAVELSTHPAGAACTCDATGRGPVDDAVRSTAVDYLRTNGLCADTPPASGAVLPACGDVCLCEDFQAQGTDLAACQDDAAPPAATNGWCYVSPDDGVGAPALVAECQSTQRRRVIFYGDALPEDEIFLLACAGSSSAPDTPGVDAPLGAPCVPSDEYRTTFNGYSLSEVNLDTQNPACASGLCVVNHFQGRVSCPYGQAADQVNTAPECYLPASDVGVTVAVDPQRLARPAADTVVCSCRCDGPGAGPFCACPSDMHCSPLIQALGFATDATLAGSYCIPKGTAYDPTTSVAPNLCDADAMNCGDPRPY